MADERLVSIIIAMYEGEKYLPKCLDSVIKQTYSRLEIILVDDGSPDSCLGIAQRYEAADSRVICVHKENGGVSSARNVGLERASGEYVAIVDQDDILAEDYIAYFLELIDAYDAEIAMVPCVVEYTENMQKYSETEPESFSELWTGERAAMEMLYGNIAVGPWNKLISRNLIERFHIRFHEELFGGEGFAYSVESFQRAQRVAVGRKGVYYYRLDNYTSGMSRFRPEVMRSSFTAQQIMREGACISSRRMKHAFDFAWWNDHAAYLRLMIGSGMEGEYRDLYKECVRVCRRDWHTAIVAPISLNRKIMGAFFSINPIVYMKLRKLFNRPSMRALDKAE